MQSRALRRYRREVLLQRWRHRLRGSYGSYRHLVPSTQWVERYARLRARTGRPCSCVLCSGSGEPSRSEELAALAEREQIAEVFTGQLW
jgi:hypothetical protein